MRELPQRKTTTDDLEGLKRCSRFARCLGGVSITQRGPARDSTQAKTSRKASRTRFTVVDDLQMAAEVLSALLEPRMSRFSGPRCGAGVPFPLSARHDCRGRGRSRLQNHLRRSLRAWACFRLGRAPRRLQDRRRRQKKNSSRARYRGANCLGRHPSCLHTRRRCSARHRKSPRNVVPNGTAPVGGSRDRPLRCAEVRSGLWALLLRTGSRRSLPALP